MGQRLCAGAAARTRARSAKLYSVCGWMTASPDTDRSLFKLLLASVEAQKMSHYCLLSLIADDFGSI
jgi:hypothetical protein